MWPTTAAATAGSSTTCAVSSAAGAAGAVCGAATCRGWAGTATATTTATAITGASAYVCVGKMRLDVEFVMILSGTGEEGMRAHFSWIVAACEFGVGTAALILRKVKRLTQALTWWPLVKAGAGAVIL